MYVADPHSEYLAILHERRRLIRLVLWTGVAVLAVAAAGLAVVLR